MCELRKMKTILRLPRWLPVSRDLFLLLAAFLVANQCLSQANINFTSLNANDGLSSNTINDIIKDNHGLMWFATDDGLNKFDGTKFTVYRNEPDDSLSLQSNEILALHEDKAGNLWIGTSGGSLSMYNRNQDNFIHYPAGNNPNMVGNDVVLSICGDYQGKIWIGTYDGINILDPKTRKISDFLYNGKNAFKKTAQCLFQDSKQRMWIGTMQGLFIFDPASNTTRQFLHEPKNPGSLSGNMVLAIAEDRQGNIWVGTSEGLSKIQPGSSSFINFVHRPGMPNGVSKGPVNSIGVNDKGKLWVGTESGIDILDPLSGEISNIRFDKRNTQGLTGREIRSIYIDDQGIYWIGTFRGGIDKYDQNLSLFNLVQSNPYDEMALPAPIVTSFAEADNGQIFVGTEYGGVARFDPSTRTFKQLNLRSKRNGSNGELVVMALSKTHNKKLLAGTFGDGLFIIDPLTGNYQQMMAGPGKNQLPSNQIFSITEDKGGNIWIGTNGAGILVLNANFEVMKRYMPNPQYPSDVKLPLNGYIRDIQQDHLGDFWIATHGGGLARLSQNTNQFKIYTKANSNIPRDKIMTILEDHLGNIWVGSFGGGLGLLNRKSQQFTTYSEQHGLLNNSIYKIVEDSNGKLWISTNRGLSSFDPLTKKFSNYNYHNGIQNNNFVHGAGLKASDGTLYFGGLEGFNYFKPEFLKRNTYVPQILFTDLKISNQSITPSADGPIKENISVTKRVDLDYKQNFAISFVGLNFTTPQQNQYAYKLEGFDQDWNYVGNENIASYTNLPPGKYTFHVRASNNDGLWNNEGNSIKIIVHPPFWRTGFAYFIYILLIAGLLIYSRNKGIQRVKRKYQLQQEKMLLAEERREAERVRELDRQKIRFLTNLSHEFRTPISLILGPIDSLVQQKDSDQSHGQLQMIKRNARRLLNLVNQLLDFRKMEENELRLQPARGEFISFVREATDSFRDLAERKKIELVFQSQLSRFDTSFDHDKMERILFNLLSNAFKFTLEGGRICLLMEQVADHPDKKANWLRIKVSDTGIGIPADKQQKIFENFFQVTTTAEILNQGTGIGLSITKEFITMQGGTITVESEPGMGSCFIIELPFEVVDTPAVDAVPDPEGIPVNDNRTPAALTTNGSTPALAERDTGAVNVLLVEDNDDFRYYLKEALSKHYKVVEATNGKDGWQKALAQHPQLIISDISMPYMDGIELCKKLKADKRTHHIPVILLTALTAEEDQVRGLETGANDYITKPFNFEMLNAKVKNLLALNYSLKQTYSKQIKVLAPEIEMQSEDEKLMSAIMAYLEENLTDTQLSVEGLSRQIGMSRSSLYNKLLELTGQTPVEFIRSVKLDKAAVLLEKSDMNIAQVAYSVGFATPNYFAKSFKTKFGMLPSEYAQKMRKPNPE